MYPFASFRHTNACAPRLIVQLFKCLDVCGGFAQGYQAIVGASAKSRGIKNNIIWSTLRNGGIKQTIFSGLLKNISTASLVSRQRAEIG